MPKRAKALTALEVSRLWDKRKVGFHFVGTVPGLALYVTEDSASWVLRATVGGKRRDMGLGGYPAIPLGSREAKNGLPAIQGAHDRARNARELIDEGKDPIAERRAAKSNAAAARAKAITFDQAAERFVAVKAAGWNNAKHEGQWTATLKTYASPKFGKLLVSDVTTAHVLEALEPIWTKKTETASRLRGRIEAVLDWAATSGFREGLNPARWRGHLANLLPKPSKVTTVKHHEALPINQVASFLVNLAEISGNGARALHFAILTAARSGEVRGATWAEIDFESNTWTIPASRMKAKKEHRVPLSADAIKLLESLPEGKPEDLVFPSSTKKMLSDMTLTAVMRRMRDDGKLKIDAVPHGFRSTFRDWVSERTSYTHEAAEMALAHTIKSKVEAAYRRGDLLEVRRPMMEEWAKFCATPVSTASVTPIKGKRAVANG